MSQIKLEIKAEDILLDNYFDSENCPITKALHRAGYTDLKHTGIVIIDKEDIFPSTNSSYESLLEKLYGMYASSSKVNRNWVISFKDGPIKPIPVKDFTHILEY